MQRFIIDWHETLVHSSVHYPNPSEDLLVGQVEVETDIPRSDLQSMVEQASLIGYETDPCMADLEQLHPTTSTLRVVRKGKRSGVFG